MFTHTGTRLPDHKHETVAEARACMVALTTPAPHPWTVEPASVAQLDLIKRLCDERGLDPLRFTGTKREASLEINRLQALPKVTRQPVVDKSQQAVLDMILQLMPEDGYYAVLPPGTDKHHFLRIKRPKAGSKDQFAGGIKVQTQHSDDLDLALGQYPSGRWLVRKPHVISLLKLVVVDAEAAGMLYAKELGRCMRCRKELTDERSRYYGIGPDCEKVWPDIIARVNELKDGSYEQNRHKIGV